MIVLVVVVAILIVLFTVWAIKFNRYENCLKNIPGPRPLPIIGNGLDFTAIEELLNVFQGYRKQYGSLFRIYLGFYAPSIIITDTKFLEFLLGSTTLLDKSDDYQFLSNWLGTGLLTSRSVKWKKHRKIITPAFHFRILEQFVDTFDDYSNILVDKLSKEIGKRSTNIYPYITLCSLDIICATSMGTKVNAQEDSGSEYVVSVKEMCRIVIDRSMSILKSNDTIYKFSKDYQKEKKALRILHGYTESVIESRNKEVEQNYNSINEDEFGRKKKKTLLDLLLQYKKDGQPLSDVDIREEVDTFMFEGHDTTASALSFALYCLAKNQHVQENVVKELKSIFGDDTNRPATHSELQEMKYLENVIKETLRLYPSVPIYARNVPEDTEFEGSILPKNSSLAIFAYGIHRDPDIYPDPERFDPDRFTLENQMTRSPYAYIPFSAGSRNCIGQKFAMLEMKSVISKVLRHYELIEVPDHRLVLVSEIVLKSKSGVHIQLQRRQF